MRLTLRDAIETFPVIEHTLQGLGNRIKEYGLTNTVFLTLKEENNEYFLLIEGYTSFVRVKKQLKVLSVTEEDKEHLNRKIKVDFLEFNNLLTTYSTRDTGYLEIKNKENGLVTFKIIEEVSLTGFFSEEDVKDEDNKESEHLNLSSERNLQKLSVKEEDILYLALETSKDPLFVTTKEMNKVVSTLLVPIIVTQANSSVHQNITFSEGSAYMLNPAVVGKVKISEDMNKYFNNTTIQASNLPILKKAVDFALLNGDENFEFYISYIEELQKRYFTFKNNGLLVDVVILDAKKETISQIEAINTEIGKVTFNDVILNKANFITSMNRASKSGSPVIDINYTQGEKFFNFVGDNVHYENRKTLVKVPIGNDDLNTLDSLSASSNISYLRMLSDVLDKDQHLITVSYKQGDNGLVIFKVEDKEKTINILFTVKGNKI